MLRAVLALSACLLAGNLALAQPVTECDRLTANPSDPKAVAPGVAFNDIIAVKAIAACEEALRQHQGSSRLQYNLGRAHSRAGASGEAVRWYRLAAEQGYAAGQNSLGVMYEIGRDVPKNDEEAVRWYRLAADQGHPSAQFNFGRMYEDGRGVPKNDEEAVRWYRLAAVQGFARAQGNLGFMYANGEGVTQNDAEAVRWYRLAAEQGDAPAQSLLGAMYVLGRGVPKNDAEAVRWYRLAAEQGDARAQHSLGTMYENGSGVTRDVEKAAVYYSQAFSGGEKDAMDRLYKLLEAGNAPTTGRIENLFKGYSLLASVELCRLRIPDALQKAASSRIDEILAQGITDEAADEMWNRVYSELRKLVQIGICDSFAAEWSYFQSNEAQRGLLSKPVPTRPR